MADVEMIGVPAGTQPSTCSGHKKPGGSCRATIYWIERRSTAKKFAGVPVARRPIVRIPVDCDIDGGSHPDSLTDGRGANHYTTCPDANAF